MSRYVALPRSAFIDYSDGLPAVTADEIHVSDEMPTFSGLYDASGAPLYRVRETVAFGFQGKPRVRVPAGRR
jgi:hypothetical protein